MCVRTEKFDDNNMAYLHKDWLDLGSLLETAHVVFYILWNSSNFFVDTYHRDNALVSWIQQIVNYIIVQYNYKKCKLWESNREVVVTKQGGKEDSEFELIMM